MIKEIICHIDDTIKNISFIDQCYGLAELVINDEDKARKYPAIYLGKDNLQRIDFEPGICYHRISGPMTTTYLNADDNGKDTQVQLIYPIILVACIDRDKQTDVEIIQKLMFELSQITYSPLKGKIKFQVIKLKLTSQNIDRFAVWNAETDGAGLSVDFDKALISISYQIDLTTYLNCLDTCN